MILRVIFLFTLGVSVSVHGLVLTPSQTVTVRSVGENTLFTCRNNGPDAGIPQWTDKNGDNIYPLDSGGLQDMHTVIDPFAKQSDLNIFNIKEAYDGSYGCIMDGDSDSRRLIVFEELTFPNQGNPDPDEQEDTQAIIIHEADRVECTITGNPKPTVKWTIRNAPVNPNDPRFTLQETGTGKTYKHILAISNVTRNEEGVFKCTAQQLDQGVVKVLPITVDVQEPPKIVLPPQDKNGTEGNSVTFYCRAEGDPQPEYTWYRGGGTPLENGEKYEITDQDRELTIHNLVKDDLGDYTCQAENAAGIEQAAGTLKVFVPPLMNPQNNDTKRLNNMVELKCFLRRGEEDTWLRWRRDGKWLKDGKQDFNERWEVYSIIDDVSTELVLRITGIQKEDEGPYTCWGKNDGGEDEVDHWLLVEYTPVIDLERTRHSVWGWYDNESNMTCYWDGFPMPTVRWSKNGIPLKDGVNATIETEVVTGGVITILYITPTSLDFGPYECFAKNKLGESSHRIIFEQALAPEMPTNIRVLDVTSTTFTLDLEEPEDDGGLRIEGYQIGYHIEGAWEEYSDFNETEKLRVKGLTPERTYYYRVAAVNDVGVGEYSDNKTVLTKYYSAPDPPVILSKWDDGRGDKYTLEWREADDNGGSIVTAFYIHYSEVKNRDVTELGPDPKVLKVDKNTVAYTISELLPGEHYWIEIFSENTFGQSDRDGINIQMPGGVPQIPTTKYSGGGPKVPGKLQGKVSTAGLIGIILGAFFILLLLVDCSCYCMNSCGFLMCICVHCCGQVPPDEKDDLEMGDGPPGYGKDLDRSQHEIIAPLRDSDEDSVFKPAFNGYTDQGGEDHLPGYRAVPRETQA